MFDLLCMLNSYFLCVLEENEKENNDPISRPSPSPMPENEGFSKDQTLFLIDLMRQHLDSEGDDLPKTLADLNARLKHGKANKKTDKSTGKGAMRFQFYTEMDDLLEGQHNVVFPVVGTSEGLEVHRPEAVGHFSSVTASAATASSRPATPNSKATATLSSPSPTQTPCKCHRVDEDLMSFLVQSEEASQQQHEETLAQMKSAQQGFEALMGRLLDKMS